MVTAIYPTEMNMKKSTRSTKATPVTRPALRPQKKTAPPHDKPLERALKMMFSRVEVVFSQVGELAIACNDPTPGRYSQVDVATAALIRTTRYLQKDLADLHDYAMKAGVA
jgi:hypothetical protein